MNDTLSWVILRCKLSWLSLIILSLSLCPDSFSQDVETDSMSERSSKEQSAGELMRAIMLYSIDIGISSDSPIPDPFVKLGNCYAQLGQADLALVNYEKALKIARRLYGNEEDKRLANIYFNSARAYDKKHMHKAAIVLYEKTIELDPQFPNAKYLCAWILATSHDSAVRDVVRALELAKLECVNSGWDNPVHLDTYAAAQAGNRNFSEAIKWVRVAIESEEEALTLGNFKQRLKFYQRGMPHRQQLIQPEPVTVKEARHTREIEYFVRRHFKTIRDKPRNTIADSALPDSLETMKEGLYAVALEYSSDEEDSNQVKLKKLLKFLRLNEIDEIKSASRMQLFDRANRSIVNRDDSSFSVYRPFKLREYVFYSQSNPWRGVNIVIDNISITKKDELTIAVIKHITQYGDKGIEYYTTLFIEEREGVIKVLTVLTTSKFMPDVVTKQFKELRAEASQDKRKRIKKIPIPHKFDMKAYILSLSSIAENLDLGHHDAIVTLIELYNSQGERAKAEKLLDLYLKSIGKKYGVNHPEMADSLNKLAGFHRGKSDYIKAENLLKRALAVNEKPLEPTRANVSYLLGKLEEAHCCGGNEDAYELRLKQSLERIEKQFGPDHPRVADSLNDLAVFYGRRGNYAKAGPLFERLLELKKHVLGADNLRSLGSLKKLAEFYIQQGEFAKAEPLLNRSLIINEKLYGSNNSNVVRSLHDLAELYSKQGVPAKAEPLLTRSVQIHAKSINPSYFTMAYSFNRLIRLYCNRGDYDKAEPLIRQLLAYEDKGANPNLSRGSEVETEFSVLADRYSRKGDFALAEDLRKRTLTISEQVYGPNDSRVAYSLIDLADIYLEQGDRLKAEPLLKRSLTVAKQALYGSPDHSLMAAIINKLSKLYRDTNRIPEAEKLERSIPKTSNKWRSKRNQGMRTRSIKPARF